MKRMLFAVAFMVFAISPELALAQDTQEEMPEAGIVTISKFKVPLGEERAQVMQFIERMMAPQEEANPHVMAFYVLQHYYGADARDVALVRVYRSFADVEAPCGEPCQAWMEENAPEEGTPEYQEMTELADTFMKYYATHSDEIYSVPLAVLKN